MEKEWHRIISFNGSQANAFEEMVCQLAMNEENAAFTHFERVGTPDGGVECYWQLNNDNEWGWQAKYYEQLGSSEWNSIKISLFDAVETHPNLVRYFIAVPHNLSDARRGKRTQKAIWDDYKAEWIKALILLGRKVELILWSSSILFSKILKPYNAGIEAFFFEAIEIKEEKLFLHLDAAIANLGPKYSPDLNFKLDELPLAFDALSRNERFERTFTNELDSLLRVFQDVINDLNHNNETKHFYEPLRQHYESITLLYHNTDFTPLKPIPVYDYVNQIKKAIEWISKIGEAYESIEKKYQDELREKVSSENKTEEYKNKQSRKTRSEINNLDKFSSEARKVISYLQGSVIHAANEGILFLKGMPGTGKSHLLADIALERKKNGIPSILLLGEHFPVQSPKNFIQQTLYPSKSLEEYLWALESLAKAKGQRLLFIIDAINEGAGKQIWKSQIAGFVKELKAFKWIGFVFSYRTTFEDVLMPEGFKPPLLTHNGFEGIEYEATKKFFEYYKIQQPAIPILNPEFSNPLFLKTFCTTLNKAGVTTIPEGYEGISKILEEYIAAINKNIAERLSYNKRINIVQKAIDELVKYQVETQKMIIPWETSFLLLEPLIKIYSASSGLLDELIREGLLIEDYYWDHDTKKYEHHGIVFNYERLNEHLKALYLLIHYEDVVALKQGFSREGKLYKMFIDKHGFSGRNTGLLNAFAIIIPEKFGVELYEVFKLKEHYAARRMYDAFLQSLLWRKHNSIKSKTWKYVTKFIRRNEENITEFYNIILLLAAHPAHYYNANFLHDFLKNHSVGERDYMWSIQVDNLWKWHDRNSIKRIIDWSWSEEEKTYTKDVSIYLLGKTLAWLFTNSNRYIRDKATKAFATLFIDRIHLLKDLFDEFKDVNDPYVLERIMAGSFGAIVHSSSQIENKKYAQHIYDIFFRNRKPPINVNTREYARCIIEWVVVRDDTFDCEKSNLYPPFDYEFPTDIPDEDWVKTIEIQKDSQYTVEERGQSRISFSVLHWDFARYILGTNHGSSIPFSDYTIKSRVAFQTLKKELRGIKRKMFEMYVSSLTMRNGTSELGKKIRRLFRDEKLQKEIEFCQEMADYSSNFLKENLESEEWKLFESAKPFIESGFESEKYKRKRFPVELVQRYIIKKAFDLGWTIDRFGYYDGNVEELNRKADKPERIGKKYQWIAYYEIMALLSDNFEFLSRDDDNVVPYKGTWQHHLRNIDPTCLSIKRPDEKNFEKTWWVNEAYTNWNEDRSTWLERFDDMPNLENIISSKDGLGEEWYLLYDRIVWKSETPLGKDRYKTDHKDLWIDVNAYLVTKRNKSLLLSKGETTHLWLNQQAPENPDYYNIFLAELYTGEAYNDQIKSRYEKYPYHTFSLDGKHIKIILTAEEYGFSDEYDLSGEKVRLYRPSKFLFELFDGTTGKNDACIYDRDGNVIAMDAGAYFGYGERSLLVKKKALDDALAKNELELIWFFCGEKEDIGSGVSYVYRMLYSGFLCFENGQFKMTYHHTKER